MYADEFVVKAYGTEDSARFLGMTLSILGAISMIYSF